MITITPYRYENQDAMDADVNQIMEQLDSGKGFEKLATQYSQDGKRSKGGDWGWLKRNELQPEISNVAFELEEGAYSQPVHVNENIFIIYVEERREEGVQDIEKVRGDIEQAISARLARQSAQRWLERLRKKAYIKYYLEEANRRPQDNAPVQMQLGKPQENAG